MADCRAVLYTESPMVLSFKPENCGISTKGRVPLTPQGQAYRRTTGKNFNRHSLTNLIGGFVGEATCKRIRAGPCGAAGNLLND